jgi:hypothetical protein
VLRDLHAIPPHTSLFRAASALLRGQHKICTKNIPRSRPGPAMFDRHRLTIDSLHETKRNETKPAGRTRNPTQPCPTRTQHPPPPRLAFTVSSIQKSERFLFRFRARHANPGLSRHSPAGWLAGGDRHLISPSGLFCFLLIKKTSFRTLC